MKQSSSNFKDFTSGGQVTMHSIRMFGQASRSVLIFCSVIFLSLLLLVVFLKTEDYDRYILGEYLGSHLKMVFQNYDVIQVIKNQDGTFSEMRALDFIEYPLTLESLKNCFEGFILAVKLSILGSFLSFFFLAYYFNYKGRKQRSNTELTGQMRVSVKKINKLLHKKKMASDYTIAGVPLLKGSEVQHILLAGTTGTGKSICFQELMDQVRSKKQRAIVYDIEGAFIPKYYREGKDVILNPLDERSPAWNIWQECEDSADFEAIANSLMPLHLAGSDPFWIHSARTIFASAAERLQKENNKSMKALLQSLFSENLGSLSSLVNDSVAESLVSDKNERTALSIKATLSTHCKSLMYLKDDAKGELFSIRRWVAEDKENDDSWLFIASNEQKVDALKSLISVWLDVATKSVLSLEPSDTRRLWFMLDELPSLHRLPSFMNTLARGRKYGSCFVSAIQDLHQLRAIYGRDETEALTALFNTNIFYRTKCPDSAAWMSKIMGGLEMIEKREGYSYGANDMRDGVSVHQERRREPVVKDSEFLELNDLQAFLRLPGNWPVTELKFEFKKRENVAPALVSRRLTEALLFEREDSPKVKKKIIPNEKSDQSEVVESQKEIKETSEEATAHEENNLPELTQLIPENALAMTIFDVDSDVLTTTETPDLSPIFINFEQER
jgi:type IV conjugative transfer system coupling protein TraD